VHTIHAAVHTTRATHENRPPPRAVAHS
jgi:hypothetical protein